MRTATTCGWSWWVCLSKLLARLRRKCLSPHCRGYLPPRVPPSLLSKSHSICVRYRLAGTVDGILKGVPRKYSRSLRPLRPPSLKCMHIATRIYLFYGPIARGGDHQVHNYYAAEDSSAWVSPGDTDLCLRSNFVRVMVQLFRCWVRDERGMSEWVEVERWLRSSRLSPRCFVFHGAHLLGKWSLIET